MIRRLIILLLIVGCYTISNDSINKISNEKNDTMVRVINKREDAIKTVIGSTDYGIIAFRDTSEYKPVDSGNNEVYLNNEHFKRVQFREGQQNTANYWTYTISKSGYILRGDIIRPEPCDNDGFCKWKDGETDMNCPNDCKFDDYYYGKYACQSHSDCKDLDEYPFCFIDYCAQPSIKLIEYINEHYYTDDCENIPCNNCTYGKFHHENFGYNDFNIEFCAECNKTRFSSTFCNAGYTCEMGLCVPDDTN